MSAASITPKWINRRVMQAIAAYVFEGVGCQLLWMRASARNETARRMFSRIGASEVVIPRLLGRDHAAVIITLSAEQWAQSRFAQ